MMQKEFASRIIHKHDIETNWNKATTFIPKQGELIIYDIDNNYNYERFKIGDGKTIVSSLPFVTYSRQEIDQTVSAVQNALDGKADSSHTHDYIPNSLKGAANGLAELDSSGKVISSQLPSYVDDVIEGYLYNSKFYKESAHTTVITGETGKIYIDLSSSKTYRWSGSAFAEISASLALGETSSTAYRGDRGKTAYDHSQAAHAPSNAEKNQNAFSNVTVGSTTITADSTTDTLTLVAGSNVTITPDATNDKITIAATNTDTNTTYDLAASASSANGNVKLNLTAGGSGSGTDSVSIKGSGATTVTTDANGVITISSTDNDTKYTHPDTHAASMITGLATVATSGKYSDLSGTPTIPTKTSQLTNDSGFKTTDNNTTYTLTKSGSTITLNGSDGSTTSVTDADNNTTYSAAGSSLGLVKSGGDVTISNGVITVNDDSHNHTIANVDGLQTALNGKANDFSIEIYNGTGGNPKPVRFASFNYSTCNSENGIAAKISLVSGHGNGSSYAFLQDAIIRVSYDGSVEVDNFKYYGTATGTYDGANRQYGDIFWLTDSTNKIIDFYCLMGQYSRVNQTPWKRLTYSTGGTVTQHTSCTVYSSGTKVWANNSDIALVSDISTIANNTTYTLTKSGSTITLTGSDGKTSSVTDADTDTKYTHPTSSGNKHIPSGGSSGQILRWSADGTATWGADNNTTYSQATSSALGLVKIGFPESGKNYPVELNSSGQMYVNVPWTDNDTKYTHPTYTAKSSGLYKVTVDGTGHVSAATAVTKADITALGIPGSDTNTTYGVVSTTADGLAPKRDGSTTKFLRADGTWAVPPDNNTVYTHPSTHPASMITGLAKVATSGSYNDLSNKPSIPAAYSHPSTHPASMITGLATVATSGNYNDLSNKPTVTTVTIKSWTTADV